MELKGFSLYLSTFTANLLAFTAGITYGWSSPILPKLTGTVDNPLERPITPFEESLIVGMLSLGGILSPVISGLTADKIGRKKTLLLITCPILVSLFMLAFAKTVITFYAARFLMGLGIGSVFMIVPMYLVEISEDHNRGLISSLFGVLNSLGLLFPYAVGPYLSVQNFCLVCTVPLIVFIPLFLVCNPESPVYLATLGDQKRLKDTLLKLRNKPVGEIEKEMAILGKIIQEMNQNKGGIRELFVSSYLRKGLVITAGIVIFQQFAGINAVLSYMQSIFNATGSDISSATSTVIIGIIQVCATILSSCLVERLGRKILLLISSTGSGLSLLSLGVYFYLFDNNFNVGAISWLPIVSLVVFIISFNLGLAFVPWTIMGELFPPNVKSVALTLTTVVCFVGASVITLTFPTLTLVLGMAGSFWTFATICGLGVCFTLGILFETKGKSLQEIQRLLGRND